MWDKNLSTGPQIMDRKERNNAAKQGGGGTYYGKGRRMDR